MDMSPIRGVDSTERKTYAKLGPKAKLVINEKLMTHGRQHALSDVSVDLDGEDSVLQIVSRSVGKDDSVQVFHPIARGNSKCRAHVQCDSILMGNAKISSIPEIAANHVDAQVIHEAAIGKINSDQLIRQTFGRRGRSGASHRRRILEITGCVRTAFLRGMDMKHRRMIVFIYLLLSFAAYVLFAHWMWDGGTLGMLDPAEAGLSPLSFLLSAYGKHPDSHLAAGGDG